MDRLAPIAAAPDRADRESLEDSDPVFERRLLSKATANGAVAIEIHFYDGSGNSVPRSRAVGAEVVELDPAGAEIARTLGRFGSG